MMGTRKEKMSACSRMPAPAGAVELVELLKVPGAMVVLEVELDTVVLSVLWETPCVEGKRNRGE